MSKSEDNENLSDLMSKIRSGVSSAKKKIFTPTGVLEPVIVNCGKVRADNTTIVAVVCANKLGKTATAINVAKNIFWGAESDYFNYNAYTNWPIVNDSLEQIKAARFAGTTQNMMTSGPIREEILKWWPEGRYTEEKSGKTYYSLIKTDTKWVIDLLTYEQDPLSFEGPVKSFQWLDEPPPHHIIGSVTSRFSSGGLLLFTMTPVGAGVFLDYLDDLREKGADLVTVTGTIWENSKTDGILNSKGEKRGLMSNEQIENYIKTIPLDERDVRIKGISSHKSGKIYPDFDLEYNVVDFDLTEKSVQLGTELWTDLNTWNCYMTIDPHPKYYHCIQWWAVDNNDNHILYNEWPTFDDLGAHYDEVRTSKENNYTIKDMVSIIKTRDGTQYGLKVLDRFVDPWFVSSETVGVTKKSRLIVEEFGNYGITLTTPKREAIAIQRDAVRNRLKWEKTMPMTVHNRPRLFMRGDCSNSIRSISRHHWLEGKEKEAETFKDHNDAMRAFEAGVQRKNYIDPKDMLPDKKQKDKGSWSTYDYYASGIKLVPLG